MSKPRSITTHVLAVFGAAFFVLVSFSALVFYGGLFTAFERVEEDLARENLARAEAFFAERLRFLDVLCFDWAQWDDAYRFVEDRNQEFVRSSLQDSAFTDSETDVCLFLDRSGRVIWRWTALWDGEVPGTFTSSRVQGRLVEGPLKGDPVSGIFMSSLGPMFLSARPVQKSDGSGPVNGVLLMGRYLDQARIAALSDQLQMEIGLYPVRRGTASQVRPTAPAGHGLQKRTFVLPEVTGGAGLAVEIVFPARVTAIGSEAVTVSLLSMILLFVGVLALLVWVLRRLVLRPLSGLQAQVRTVREQGPDAPDLTPGGPAEFIELGRAFNSMLGALRERDSRLSSQVKELKQARQAADAANASKSRFLACMTHDLRTPLNGILGLARILSLSDLTQKQAEHVRHIRASGAVLLELVDNILDGTSLESGRFSLRTSTFDPRAVAGEVLDLTTLLAEQKGLDMVRRIEPEVPAVQGDSGRFRQILFNLLGNGIKFTDSGEVGLELCCSQQGGDRVEVRVSVFDTGIGISREDQDRIFEYFGRAREGAGVQGTGLGLAITRELVECMGGTIRIRSRAGRGTRFDVLIPFARGEEDRKAVGSEEEDQEPHDFSLHVLVAEDNAVNTILAREVFAFFGCRVTVVGNGKEAVARWERERFDIVFMDWQMPGMDGLEATRRIRDIEGRIGRPRTPVIGLSANATARDREKGAAAGMDRYLSKPFSMAAIRHCLAEFGGSQGRTADS
jgi:signal transduction histidine kinase/ActR/RegA family two-component response regulator